MKLWNSIWSWIYHLGFPGGSDGTESACNAGDPSSIPGLGRSARKGNGNPLRYSCLENPMNRGASWAILSMGSQRVGHNRATHTHTHTHIKDGLGRLVWEDVKEEVIHEKNLEKWISLVRGIGSETDKLAERQTYVWRYYRAHDTFGEIEIFQYESWKAWLSILDFIL